MLYKAIFKDVSKDVDFGFRLPVPNSEQQHSHSRFLAKNKEKPFHSPRLRRLFARSCYSVFALTANLHLVPSYFQTRMAIDQIRPDHSTTTTGIWGGIFARYGVFSNVSFINLFPFFLLPFLLCCSHTHTHSLHSVLLCFSAEFSLLSKNFGQTYLDAASENVRFLFSLFLFASFPFPSSHLIAHLSNTGANYVLSRSHPILSLVSLTGFVFVMYV